MSQSNTKKKVIIFASHYLPGYKAGGPIKSISNAVQALLGEYDICVITRDRDLGAHQRYEGLGRARTATHGGVTVHYLAPGPSCIGRIRRLILELKPDLLYLNSFFDPIATTVPLLLRRCRLIPRNIGIALAPRGEFSTGALSIKPLRKRFFLRLAKEIDLYREVIWQATAEKEVREIRGSVSAVAPVILVVPDPPALAVVGNSKSFARKSPNGLRLVFLSRISRMKNLTGALTILKKVRAQVEFSVYGPAEDPSYWSACQQLMADLPVNVKVEYRGALRPDQVTDVLATHDLLFLPTLGENFGHVICEAWAAGCPVLISDNTPWKDLEAKGLGWDLPLSSTQRFREVIEECACMDSDSFERMKHRARSHAERLYRESSTSSSLRTLFSRALEAHGRVHAGDGRETSARVAGTEMSRRFERPPTGRGS